MSKNKQGHGVKMFSSKYFLEPFPLNHNPLIGMLHKDTLNNVNDDIALLQDLTVNPDEGGLMLSEFSNMGYFFLMDCVLYVLRFEIYHQKE